MAGITMLWAQGDTLFLNREAALALALENNPNMQVAALNQARAQARLDESRGNLLPSLNASGSYSRNFKKQVFFFPDGFGGSTAIEIGRDNSFMGGLQLSMPLYNPAINAGVAAARTEQKIAEEEFRAQSIDLTWSVQQAWYDALLAAESLEVIELSFNNARENLDNIRKMYQQGMVAEYDLIRAEVQTENIRPEMLQANNMYELSLNYLKILLGLDETQDIVIQGSLLESSEEMLRDFTIINAERSLQQNPDYVNLGLQHDLMLNQAKTVRATGLPSLTAVGNYMYLTESNDFDVSEFDWVNTATGGLQLNIPIFRGRTTRNQVKQIEIGAQQLQIQREYLKDNLGIELANAIKSMELAIEKAEHAGKNVNLAKRSYDISRVRYNSGQGTLLEINDSDVALTRARFNLLQANHELLQAKIRYDRYLGEQ